MNTKHFYKDVNRFKNLMDAIEREINTKVRNLITNKFSEVNDSNLDISKLMVEIKSGTEVVKALKDQ